MGCTLSFLQRCSDQFPSPSILAIMDFDVYGSWSTTAGPNSPLNDTCAPSADQDGSAVSGVRNWMKAGFAAHQVR